MKEEGEISLFSFLDCLVSRWTTKINSHKLNLKRLRRQLRIQSFDLAFIFQKGPHKYSHGTVVHPRSSLCERISEILVADLRNSGKDKSARRLAVLVSNLPKNTECTNNLLFLFLVATSAPESSSDFEAYEQYQVPLNPSSSISYSNPTGALRHLSVFSSVQPRASSTASASAYKFISGNSVFTRQCDHPSRGNLCSITPGIISGCIQTSDNLRSSQCATASCEEANFTRPSPRMIDEEDEGYCELSFRADNRLLNCEDIENIVLRLFSQHSPAIGQLCWVPGDETLLANKDLKTILPLISSNSVQRFSWECRGLGRFNKEMPYLSEVGSISVEAVLALRKERFGFLSGSGEDTEKREDTLSDDLQFHSTALKSVPTKDNSFIRDLLLMRIGIQSERFQYFSDSRWTSVQNENRTHPSSHPLTGFFMWVPNNQDSVVLGVSSQCLSNFLSSHLKAGTQYRKLCWFAYHVISLIPTPTTTDGPIWRGQIWTCFVQGLKTWLSTYENSIHTFLSELSGNHNYGLLRTAGVLRRLSKQIQYVADLCMLNYKQPDGSTYPLLKLSGVELLAYLLSKADCSMCHYSERIVRFLFKEAAQPLIKFLEMFALDGIYDDVGNEFNLIVSNEHLLKRDSTFWSKSFRFSTYGKILDIDIDGENVLRVPLGQLLPKGFEEEILCCAKSVLLLKAFAPRLDTTLLPFISSGFFMIFAYRCSYIRALHFIFQTRSRFPTLCLLETIEEMSSYHDAFQEYQKLLNDTTIKHVATREQKVAQMIAERQEFIKYVNQIQSARLAAIEAKRVEQLKARLAKQNAELSELKLAAETAAKQRREAIEAEKKADQLLLESISVSNKYKEVVINEAKAELESFYANLIEEVDRRRNKLEQHIENDQIIIETLEPSAAKALEFKASHIATTGYEISEHSTDKSSVIEMYSNQSDQSNQTAITFSTEDQQVTADCSASELYTMQSQEHIPLFIPSNLSTSDPLIILRTKFHQRNKGAYRFKDQMSELIHGSGDTCLNPEFINPQDVNDNTKVEGNKSNFMKPSVWEAERIKEDAIHSGAEPDAVTFYKEVLETSENASAVKPYTKEFPSLGQNPQHVSSMFINRSLSKSSNELKQLFENTSNALMVPLGILINRSIIWPISIHMNHVNSTLCNYFIFDLRLCDHFHCLYETFFLTNGSFSRPLLDELFRKAAGPLHDRAKIYDTHYLQQFMKSVIMEISSNQQLLEYNNQDCDNNSYNLYMNTTVNFPLLNTTNLMKNHLNIISSPVSRRVSTTTTATDTSINNEYDAEIGHSNNSSSNDDPHGYVSFNHLRLMYNSPWPINLCLNSNILDKYNCIFQRLIQCQFALWALNSCFLQLKHDREYLLCHLLTLKTISSKSSSKSLTSSSFLLLGISDQLCKTFHYIHIWLYELHQVIHNLNMHFYNYITICWSKFMKYLGLSNTQYNFMSDDNPSRMYNSNEKSVNVNDSENLNNSEHVNSLDSLCTAHEKYLNDIIFGCLLDPSDNELDQILQGMLTCAHQFHRALLTGRWITKQSHKSDDDEQIEHTEWRQLHSVHSSFRSYSQFLRRRVNRLLTHHTTVSGGDVNSIRSKLVQLTLIFGLNDFYTSQDKELSKI
ncbi:unnamed protein product [Heterobilharzia americana]|nr:unnamed protein product [Heterobilharzia americana]